MTATQLRTLPESGRFIIDTATDVVEVDLGRHTAHFLHLGDEAALAEARQGPVEMLIADIACTVGLPLVLKTWDAHSLDDVEIVSAVVLGITPAAK